jgi:hypothetical protein
VKKLVEEKYTGKKAKVQFGLLIQFGTYKLNSETEEKENYIISPEDMQAHKVYIQVFSKKIKHV